MKGTEKPSCFWGGSCFIGCKVIQEGKIFKSKNDCCDSMSLYGITSLYITAFKTGTLPAITVFPCVCMHVGERVSICTLSASVWRCQRRASDTLELKLQVVMSHWTWVSGTELESFRKRAHRLNHCAISPAPQPFYLIRNSFYKFNSFH
jgi:hypothetical protein